MPERAARCLAFGAGKGTDHLAVYSRDGSRIVTCGTNGWIQRNDGRRILRTPAGYAIKIWDADTGREAATIPSKSSILAMALGSDGNTITTLDHENQLQVWQIDGGREIATIKGTFPEGNRHIGANKWVTFDARARRVVLSTIDFEEAEGGRATAEGVLKLWDVNKNEFRNVYPRKQLQFDSGVGSCLLSPDGIHLVTIYALVNHQPTRPATGGQMGAILDFATLTVLRRTVPELVMDEYLVAFSPDGKWFISSRQDGILRIWDVATGRIRWTIKGPEGVDIPRHKERTIATRAVAFLPRGIRVVSGGIQGWNEVDTLTNRIIADPVTGEVLRVEPLQVWDAEFDWNH